MNMYGQSENIFVVHKLARQRPPQWEKIATHAAAVAANCFVRDNFFALMHWNNVSRNFATLAKF